jgi:hypothetical protein
VPIKGYRAAIKHADAWQAHAQRLEALLLLATAQKEASELLLAFAEAEIERIRGLL